MNFYKFIFVFLLVFIFLNQKVLAHDILQSLSKEQMTEVQQNLVAKGYLKMPPGAVYGVYGPLTEDAFNRFQNDRAKLDNQDTSLSDTGTGTLTDNSEQGFNFFSNFFDLFVDFIKNIFAKFF